MIIYYHKKMDIEDKIFNARKALRDLYEKYIKEFNDIHIKIDKYLESLQKKEDVKNE